MSTLQTLINNKEIGMQEPEYRAVYRLSTSCYQKGGSFVAEKKLTKMKRKSYGYDPLEEEIQCVGEFDAIDSLDIYSLQDGLYCVEVTNYSRDYETGEVDYEIEMHPYREEEPNS